MTPAPATAPWGPWGPGVLGPDGRVYHRRQNPDNRSPWGLDKCLICGNIKTVTTSPQTAPVTVSAFPSHSPIVIQLGHCSPVIVDYVGEALREFEARSIADDVAKQIVEWLWARGLDVATCSHTDDYNAAAAVFGDLFTQAQAATAARADADFAQVAAGLDAAPYAQLVDVANGGVFLWTPDTYTRAVTAQTNFLIAQDRFELARVKLARAEAALKLAQDHMERRFAGLVAKFQADARRAFAALGDE